MGLCAYLLFICSLFFVLWLFFFLSFFFLFSFFFTPSLPAHSHSPASFPPPHHTHTPDKDGRMVVDDVNERDVEDTLPQQQEQKQDNDKQLKLD